MRTRRGRLWQKRLPTVAVSPADGAGPGLRGGRRGCTTGARAGWTGHEQQERAVNPGAQSRGGSDQRGHLTGQGGVRAGVDQRNSEGVAAHEGHDQGGDSKQRRDCRLRGHRGATELGAGVEGRCHTERPAGDPRRGEVRGRSAVGQRGALRRSRLMTHTRGEIDLTLSTLGFDYVGSDRLVSLDERVGERALARPRGGHERHAVVARDARAVRPQLRRARLEHLLLRNQNLNRLTCKPFKRNLLPVHRTLGRLHKVHDGVVLVARAHHHPFAHLLAQGSFLDVAQTQDPGARHLLGVFKRP
mmetsp:Transcript_11230/g.52147  ORF Transcript_11230/g.52147 Transcript_11230/m.52147 type:complete len:302 (+) Transcript_11230:781-1686(+)